MFKITYRDNRDNIQYARIPASSEQSARSMFYASYSGRIICIDQI